MGWALFDAARRFVEQQSSKLSFGVSQLQQQRQQRWFSGCGWWSERSSTRELADGNLLGEIKRRVQNLLQCVGDNIANIKLSWAAW
ncbi:MAG: hypothetical protein KME29_09980 [Calothrix sp. FI2-JRJ7]|jgi:hypothetical protein|nr:hypothetical protein [Calothrix sp. FI2-JRJ7]